MSRTAQKHYAEDLIHDVLDEIKGEARQPDEWERSAISYALDCLQDGIFSAAIYEAAIALTPELQRSTDFTACPANAAMTLADLERKLAQTRALLVA
jgi:hypothetical protein